MTITNIRFAFRHLNKNRFNTTLHIVGLTIGLSVCLVIGLYLNYELDFDSQYKDADRTYRINFVWTDGNDKHNIYATPIPLAEAIRNEIMGFDKVSLVLPQYKSVIEVNHQKLFNQELVLVVQPDYLNIFDIKVLRGNGYKALTETYQALLTESTAEKLFDGEDPMGKTFKYRNEFTITVAGIVKDLPSNTSLPATMFLSYVDNEHFLNNGDTWHFGDHKWVTLSSSTFVVLSENQNPKRFEQKLRAIADKNINLDPSVDKLDRGDFEMQPISNIHFDDKFGGGPWVRSIKTSLLWLFTSIGIMVLLMACINFLNLSTAQALKRSREVGIRKSIGAQGSQLIMQFLYEAWIITIASSIFSIIIIQFSLPFISRLTDKAITLEPLVSIETLSLYLLGVIVTGLLAGIYPAWIIAKFNPVNCLKTSLPISRAGRSSGLRKVFVTAQFTTSSILLIVVFLIDRQVSYMQSKDLGFEKDNIINVPISNFKKSKPFSIALSQIPEVKMVSFNRMSPISNDHWWNGIRLVEEIHGQGAVALYADHHFYSLHGLHLLSGQIPESLDHTRDSISSNQQVSTVVVNDKLLRALNLGLPHEAIGKRFWWGGLAEIVGVVADFNVQPLQSEIVPTLINQNQEFYSQASIKIEPGRNLPRVLNKIEIAWKKTFENEVYEFTFLDERIDSFYKSETKLYILFQIFTGLALVISCLGLWGLVTFATEQRTKEIGIRKVLGASVNSIFILLSGDFILTVIIAFLISSPIASYFMITWLQGFAYHINIEWPVFASTGLVLLSITFITISYNVLRAALSNPVNSLRAE